MVMDIGAGGVLNVNITTRATLVEGPGGSYMRWSGNLEGVVVGGAGNGKRFTDGYGLYEQFRLV
jgi:hypothetical protein